MAWRSSTPPRTTSRARRWSEHSPGPLPEDSSTLSLHGGCVRRHHNWERAGGDFYKYDFTDGARRYDAGQRSNFITLPGAVASLRQLAAWGPANIERYIAPLIERAAERALALGMTVPPPAARSDHMIGRKRTLKSEQTRKSCTCSVHG